MVYVGGGVCSYLMNQDVFFVVLIALMTAGLSRVYVIMFQNYDRHTQAHKVEVTAGISPDTPTDSTSPRSTTKRLQHHGLEFFVEYTGQDINILLKQKYHDMSSPKDLE